MGEPPGYDVQAEPIAPGSSGEHLLQRRYGSQERARRFYERQVLDRLNGRMVQFIGRQEMVWIATADGDNGERPRVERWVEVHVQEAYVHCRKHLPRLVKAANGERAWGTDDARAKGGDYFGTSCEPRPWVTDA